MKILQIVQRPQRRGAEVFAYQLSRALCSHGHQVQSVYLYPYQGQGGLSLEQEDSLLGGQDTHPFEKFPGVHPALLRRLGQVLDTFQPDIVQVNGASTVKYGAFARMFRRERPWVLIYRNIGNPQDWVRGRQRRFFYRRLVMPQIDGVVGVSQTTLNTIQSFYALTVPLQCIPNGIEIPEQIKLSRLELRHHLQTPEDAYVLLFVGSLSIEKRVDRLLRVAQRVHEQLPNLHLWLVGDGPQRHSLVAQTQTTAFADRVHFVGIKEDITSFMAAADLFLLTSDTEGIPAAVLEAGAQGLPVVATRVGGMAECVLEGETGFLVESQDESNLANAVIVLLENPDLRQRMGKQAQKWVSENFTMANIAQQYIDFYQQVLRVKNGPLVCK